MEALYLLSTALIGLLLFVLFTRRGKQSLAVPGLPASSPETGNLSEIAQAGSLTQFQLAQHSRFGGVFSFYLGKHQVVSVADPHYIHDIAALDIRAYPIFQFLEEWIGPHSIQFASPQEYWRRRKSYIDPAFGLRGIQRYEQELIDFFTKECFAQWAAAAGTPMDLKEVSLETALRSITLTAFGDEMKEKAEREKFLRAYNVIWDYLYAKLNGTERTVSPQEYAAAKETVSSFCTAFISKRQGKFEAFRFIDLLLKETDPAVVSSDMISFLIGGFHTTGYSVMWLLFFLAKYPIEQEKVAQEVAGRFPLGSADLCGAGYPSLHNFVDETLRLSQIAPTAARISPKSVTLHDGKRIPPNTPIIEALAVLSGSAGLWRNASEFYPDRFAESVDPNVFRPFGGSGKRICPGKTLSYTWLYLFLANLLAKFRVEFEPGADTRVDMVYRIVSSMKAPPKIVLTVR